MSQRKNPKKSYRLRRIGLDSIDFVGPKSHDNSVSTQKQPAFRLSEKRTSQPIRSYGVCVSPNIIKQAWENTQHQQKEFGGWIYFDKAAQNGEGTYGVATTSTNSGHYIVLTSGKDYDALIKKNYQIIADFHCHPGPGLVGGMPSDGDFKNAIGLPYKRLVFTVQGARVYQSVLDRADRENVNFYGAAMTKWTLL